MCAVLPTVYFEAVLKLCFSSSPYKESLFSWNGGFQTHVKNGVNFEHWGGQVKWHVSFIREISIKIGNVNQNARQVLTKCAKVTLKAKLYNLIILQVVIYIWAMELIINRSK